MDPRKHCKYTCKVTEVSTPLPGEEQDLRWDQEDNHTIVHSPSHSRGEQELCDMHFKNHSLKSLFVNILVLTCIIFILTFSIKNHTTSLSCWFQVAIQTVKVNYFLHIL